MSMHGDRNNRQQERLLNNQITTVKCDRRSFLARAVGASTLTFGAVLAAACSTSDPLGDSDVSGDLDVTRVGDPAQFSDRDVTRVGDPVRVSDSDPRDPVRVSDSDVTRVGDPSRASDRDVTRVGDPVRRADPPSDAD